MLTHRLKNDNWALHQIAEHQPTPKSLIKGNMPFEGYKGALAQQALINTALDNALKPHIQSTPELAEFVLEEQMFTSYMMADIEYFNIDLTSVQPEPGVQRYIDHINENKDNPWHLLGLHYVRLGACNGNSFVARVVRKTYELPEIEGTRYLDPFGKEQRSKWNTFKEQLDALDIDQDTQDKVFMGTRAAYVFTINLDSPEHKEAETLLQEHGKSLNKEEFDKHHSAHLTEEMHASLDA